MYIILWEFLVKPEKQTEFMKVYALTGAWAELFKKSPGYLGTELSRDETNSQRYLTIDRWESREAFQGFLSHWEEEYNTLDAGCEGLTVHESCIGRFETNFG